MLAAAAAVVSLLNLVFAGIVLAVVIAGWVSWLLTFTPWVGWMPDWYGVPFMVFGGGLLGWAAIQVLVSRAFGRRRGRVNIRTGLPGRLRVLTPANMAAVVITFALGGFARNPEYLQAGHLYVLDDGPRPILETTRRPPSGQPGQTQLIGTHPGRAGIVCGSRTNRRHLRLACPIERK